MNVVDLTNLALSRLGVTQFVTATADLTAPTTLEGTVAGLTYDHLLREVLRSFNWPFATAYASSKRSPFGLKLVAGRVWDDDWADYVQTWSSSNTYAVDDVVQYSGELYYCIAASTNNTPPNATYWVVADDATDPPNLLDGGDWLYKYRWPSDCLRLRRLVPESTGRRFNRRPIPFRNHRDANGQLVATNEAQAVLEYTLLDCDNLWADDIWIEAFAWRYAAALAPALSRNGLTAIDCTKLYFAELNRAAVVALEEQQTEPPGDCEWLEARDGVADQTWLDTRRRA
jgi:hypothetical protein